MAVSTVTEVRKLPVILETAESSPKSDEFENSDLYIEESLPSSLEWGRDERQVYIYPATNIDTHHFYKNSDIRTFRTTKLNPPVANRLISLAFDVCNSCNQL